MKCAKVSTDTINKLHNFRKKTTRDIAVEIGHVILAYETIYSAMCDPKLDYLDFTPEYKRRNPGEFIKSEEDIRAIFPNIIKVKYTQQEYDFLSGIGIDMFMGSKKYIFINGCCLEYIIVD